MGRIKQRAALLMVLLLLITAFASCKGMSSKGRLSNDTADYYENEETSATNKDNNTTTAAQDNTQENTQAVKEEPASYAYVRILDYIPDAVIDLKYATTDNFTGKRIYNFDEAYLRYGTVKKLMSVEAELAGQGFHIKIWDAYRPFSAQETLWEVYPDPDYVANPANGVGGHCLGNTVDITLVDGSGQNVTMPTGFDDFSVKADRNYEDCTEEEKTNVLLLENTMIKYGFVPYFGEWWDFSDGEVYQGEEDFKPPVSVGGEEASEQTGEEASGQISEETSEQTGEEMSGQEQSVGGEASYDWVSKLAVSARTNQLMIVSSGLSGITFSMHNKDENGQWHKMIESDATVGVDGIGDTKETNSKTPRGEYGFTMCFGIKDNPGSNIDYIKVDDTHYWVDDVNSEYYNCFVSTREVQATWASAEHLIDVGRAYNYAVALDYNSKCVPGEGSAIFLHVMVGNSTGGCIGVPEDVMVYVINNMTSDCRIIIDYEDNIKNY